MPQHLALRIHFGHKEAEVIVVLLILRRQEVLAVDVGIHSETPHHIDVAFAVGLHPHDAGPEFVVAKAVIVFHPIEVLGVGGDCQQREERKGEGLSCHSCVVFVRL